MRERYRIGLPDEQLYEWNWKIALSWISDSIFALTWKSALTWIFDCINALIFDTFSWKHIITSTSWGSPVWVVEYRLPRFSSLISWESNLMNIIQTGNFTHDESVFVELWKNIQQCSSRVAESGKPIGWIGLPSIVWI